MTGKAKRQFYTLYQEYFKKIYRYVYYRSGQNRDTADDLTSQVFLKAYENFDSYDRTQSFGGWIYAIARNHLIDHFRTRKQTVSLEDVEGVLHSDEDIADELHTKQEVERVLSVIDTLPDDDRELLQLRFLGQYSYAEIGTMLNKTPNALQVAVHRALNSVREKIEPLS